MTQISNREMATIRSIISIDTIPGADAIEVATVDGWKVVVKKSEYNVGDVVIYCEIDSFIPHSIAPFLTKAGQYPREYEGIEGQPLRTVKLRGQLSHGLILPMSCLTNYGSDLEIGDDVSATLGIIKYEPPIDAHLSGLVKGAFPSSIPKTDEERIQNLTARWDDLQTYSYEVTEKLEGSSCTIAIVNGEFMVCSRNLNLKEDEYNTFWKAARNLDIENKLRILNLDNIAIQEELVGEGIEGNIYEIKGHMFYVYNFYSVTDGRYTNPNNRAKMCNELGLNHVPVIKLMFNPGILSINDMINLADGQSVVNPKKLREGLVYKRVDGQEHFKTISNKYLLKHST